jgi:hypothetical protein
MAGSASVRSSIFVLVLGLGAMFVLLSFASLYSGISRERLIQELQSGRADASVSRMVEPENICFTLDDEILVTYPALARAIKEADEYAQEDIEGNNRYGNYYTGTGVDLDRSQMVSMLRTYNFNRTVSHNPAVDRLFVYQDTSFSCGFNYNGRHYDLFFSFRSLDEVNTEHGYVPIHISRDLIDRRESAVKSAITYVPFNNTAIFFNNLPSPVTVEVYGRNSDISETMLLLPGRMQDMNLRPNWSSLEDTSYHYRVKEYPWIEGDITVSLKHYVACMSKEVAKSLYAQRDFELKFPSYLPDGFATGCIAENLSSYAIQIYVNQTATDYHTGKGIMYSMDNPYPFYLTGSMPEEEVKGLVQVHAQKYYHNSEDPRQTGYDSYLRMVNNTIGYTTNVQFIEDVGGVSYLTYNEGKHLSVVDVLTADESYRIIAALPMDKVMKIATSLT